MYWNKLVFCDHLMLKEKKTKPFWSFFVWSCVDYVKLCMLYLSLSMSQSLL